jgi:hypothetical protein
VDSGRRLRKNKKISWHSLNVLPALVFCQPHSVKPPQGGVMENDLNYLFHHNAPERMRKEYEESIDLLLAHQYLLCRMLTSALYLWLLALSAKLASRLLALAL